MTCRPDLSLGSHLQPALKLVRGPQSRNLKRGRVLIGEMHRQGESEASWSESIVVIELATVQVSVLPLQL